MKKFLAILIAFMLSLSLSAPLYAVADGSVAIPRNELPVASAEPTEALGIEAPSPDPVEPDPGGALDFTGLFQAAITLLASWITLRLIPWLKARTTERQYQNLLYLVSVGAKAAENLFPSGSGPKKFAYVVEYLRRKGINVDEAEIEATVYDYFTRLKNASG